MKRLFISILLTAFAGTVFTSCEEELTKNSLVDVSDNEVLGNTSQLNKVLTSAYRQLYFNNKSERVYAGLPGFQMYVDLGGSDIICHTNMGGQQLTSYQYISSKTISTGDASAIWTWAYNVINLSNIIITNIDGAGSGDETQKRHIKGQALAMRGLMYFHLIQNYQQTYVIAKNKRGVILRLVADDESSKGFSTVEEVYQQIVADLTNAKSLLAGYKPEELWFINSEICSGILARVYLVMQKWSEAYNEAETVYNNHKTLMTREQYRAGFDEMISGGYSEVVWAMQYTPNNNIGGSTQFNFWYNQDESYGEGYADGPIYSFLALFCDSKFEELFEQTDDRYQFWKRTKNVNSDINTKWAFDKYKHYGQDNGTAIGSASYPEVCLMRSAEMLLIMAEAAANMQRTDALQLLNRLQAARHATPTVHASGQDLLEDIYIERRKELICEGQSGFYDLVRLQKPLVRYGASATNPGGHYVWGLQYLNGFDAAATQPSASLESNDYRFFCQIPQMEILNNDAISEADQNPFDGR